MFNLILKLCNFVSSKKINRLKNQSIMKTNKIFALTILMLAITATSVTKAQSVKDQQLETVNIQPADGFKELKQLLKDNFDFNNPEYKQGIVNTNVSFSVAENGKITNVQAKGDCQYVSQEIEHVLQTLLYRVDKSKLTENMLATHYTMPVTVEISSK